MIRFKLTRNIRKAYQEVLFEWGYHDGNERTYDHEAEAFVTAILVKLARAIERKNYHLQPVLEKYFRGDLRIAAIEDIKQARPPKEGFLEFFKKPAPKAALLLEYMTRILFVWGATKCHRLITQSCIRSAIKEDRDVEYFYQSIK